jgi:hypothetical protein
MVGRRSHANRDFEDDESANEIILRSTPYTSSTLWKFLFGPGHGRQHAAAVVFSLPERLYPVELYIAANSPQHKAIGDGLTASGRSGYETAPLGVHAGYPDNVTFDHPYIIHNDRGMGAVLREAGKVVDLPYLHGNIQVVIRSPVPSSCIERIIPLYRTNRKFKRRKQDRHTRVTEYDMRRSMKDR